MKVKFILALSLCLLVAVACTDIGNPLSSQDRPAITSGGNENVSGGNENGSGVHGTV